MHGRGCHHADGDQGLRTLLALDQHNVTSGSQPRLVVQRARIGRSHLAPLGIPRPELLLAPGWVVTVHDRNQFAGGIEVVPLGRGRAEIINRSFLLGAAYRH